MLVEERYKQLTPNTLTPIKLGYKVPYTLTQLRLVKLPYIALCLVVGEPQRYYNSDVSMPVYSKFFRSEHLLLQH